VTRLLTVVAAAAARPFSSQLRRTTAAILSARVVSALSTLVILAVLSRTRGLDALGIGSLGVVTGTILASLTEAGTSSLMIREIARDRRETRALLTAILVMRAITLPVFILVSIPVFALVFGSSGELVLLFALAFVIQQIGELARGILLAVGRPYVMSAHCVVENVVWALVTVAALARGADLYLAAALGLVVMVLSAVAGACLVLLWGILPGRATVADFRRAGRLALPFAAYSLVMVAAFRLDTIFVSLLVPSGIAAAGAYFAASRLITSAEYIPDSMSRAAYPDLSRRTATVGGDVHGVMRPATRDLLRLSIPIPIVLLAGGSAVLPAIFGPELAPYAWILTVLGLAIPARFLVILFGVSLTSANAQGRRVAITAVAVVFGQGLDLLLLPFIGVPAAVMASIVTTTLLLVPYAREIWRRFGTPIWWRDILVPLGCACAAAVPALGLRVLLGGPDRLLELAAVLSVYGIGYLAAMLSMPALQAAWRRARGGPGALASA
jgi:O-antigen/teichoic acid export membrane protein